MDLRSFDFFQGSMLLKVLFLAFRLSFQAFKFWLLTFWEVYAHIYQDFNFFG